MSLLESESVQTTQHSDRIRSLYEFACGHLLELHIVTLFVALTFSLLFCRIEDFSLIIWCWICEFGEDRSWIEQSRIYPFWSFECAADYEYLGRYVP